MRPLYYRLVLALGGLLLIIGSAYVTVDVGMAVPISLQSMAVLVVALVVPDAVIVVLAYVLLGIAGAPVFADGASGWLTFTGTSMGYLLGFVVATGILSWAGRDHLSLLSILQWTMIGTMVILACGVTWLAGLRSWQVAYDYGLLPYLPGAAIKIIAGTGLAYAIRLWSRSADLPT